MVVIQPNYCRHGLMAGHGAVWQGEARRGTAWRGMAWIQGMVGQGLARHGKERHGMDKHLNLNQKKRSNMNTEIYPSWKKAVSKAVDEFSYGDMIPLRWLAHQFDAKVTDEKMTHKEHTRRQFEFLNSTEMFKKELLTEHSMFLVNSKGKGYHIVKPRKQVLTAYNRLMKSVKKEFSKAVNVMINTDTETLTKSEQTDNDLIIGKTAQMSAMLRRNSKMRAINDLQSDRKE